MNTLNFIQSIFGEQTAAARMFVENEVDNAKLITARHATRIGTSAMKWLVFLGLSLVASALLSVSLSLYLGALWDNYPLGFLAGAGAVVLAIVLWKLLAIFLVRDMLARRVIKEIYEDDSQ